MSNLTLSLKAEYFHAIRHGSKSKEYRLVTPYWRKRLEGRAYDGIVLTLGYPSRDDASRRLERPWRGFVRETITHPHFGPDPVDVYAIDVADPATTVNEGARAVAKRKTAIVMPEDEWFELCAKQCAARKKLGPGYYDPDECGEGEPCSECALDALERAPAKYRVTPEEAEQYDLLPGLGS